MYQGNSSHTGYAPVSLKPNDLSLRWSKIIGHGKALNPVTSSDGKVFASLITYFDGEDSFFVLNALTGDIKWSKNFGDVFSVNPPSYAYGNVYIQTGNHASDTYLWAFKADTGDLIFKSPHLAQWERYYAPTIHEGVVYVNGGYYGGMYAFNATTGAQMWFTALQQYDQWTPAVDSSYVYAYVGEYRPALYVADRQTGEIMFQIDDYNFDWYGWSMNLAPVLGTENSVFAIQDGRLIKFDISKKQISWETNRNYSGQPSFAKGVVYTISSGTLSAVDANTGNVLWSWGSTSDNLAGEMIITDTHVLASSSTTTYAIDLLTHKDVWSYPKGGHLSLSKDALCIVSQDGQLTSIAFQPFAIPVANAGGDRIEYSNVTLNGIQSFDPDGYIVSYVWNIQNEEDPTYNLVAEGKVVNVSDLKRAFYDVILTVTDNEGFTASDQMLLAVMGPEPRCEYTKDDVIRAYDNGYQKGFRAGKEKGKLENLATYDNRTKILHIPSVLVKKKVFEMELKRRGNSDNFHVIEGFRGLER
jgi:outer membrane protein assembly factor BamB